MALEMEGLPIAGFAEQIPQRTIKDGHDSKTCKAGIY
jgi:hypothetical protein